MDLVILVDDGSSDETAAITRYLVHKNGLRRQREFESLARRYTRAAG